jgi:hypothetical protein
MKSVHVFNHDAYFNSLKAQINGKNNMINQRGGGLGSTLGMIGRYTIPILQTHVLPYAKKAAVNTANAILSGKNVKQTLSEQSREFLKNVGNDIVDTLKESGSGIASRKRKASLIYHPVDLLPSKPKQVRPNKALKHRKKPKQKATKKLLSKADIFS